MTFKTSPGRFKIIVMKNKILVYDDNCPLCSWYSSLFVRYGLLPADGRRPFSTLESSLLTVIDTDRGRNEIPLLDTRSGKVLYGIDALLEILGERYNTIKTIGKIKPFHWLLTKLYKLVSYNRKVIVAKKCGKGSIDCSPDMNYRYRMLFLLLTLIFNSVLLFPLNDAVFFSVAGSIVPANKLQAAHFTLVISNCLLALRLSKIKAMEYLGQISMLALLTILLLIPLVFIHYWFSLSYWFSVIYLAATAVFIFKEYLRRMEYTGILMVNKWIAAINLAGMSGFILFIFL